MPVEMHLEVLDLSRIVEIELTATSATADTVRHFENLNEPWLTLQQIIFRTRVFHVTHQDSIDLRLLPLEMFEALRLQEVNLQSVQWLDATIENPLLAWRQAFDGPITTHGTYCVILRANVLGEFPARWVIDMADGLHAAASQLSRDSTYDAQQLFAETFPGYQLRSTSEFIAAVYLWEDLPSSARAASMRAGRTAGGEWQTILNQAENNGQM